MRKKGSKIKNRTAPELLDYLNNTYLKLHKSFEDNFWLSYMGDHSVDKKMNKAESVRDTFSSNTILKTEVEELIKTSKSHTKKRLQLWKRYFDRYNIPKEAVAIKNKAGEIEAKILKYQTTRKEGYIDPKTSVFLEASENKMRTIMRTNPDESVRKACFDSMERFPIDTLDDYVEVIKLRNKFAGILGYEDFYDYKLKTVEDMTKKEVFDIFEKIYQKTKFALKNIRNLEKKKHGLRKPWNYSYMLSGNFTKEEDPYFQFDDALSYWGRSFMSLGVDLNGGTINLDLIDRKGKYNNGFCHQPGICHYEKGRFVSGRSNFTCNVVPGQTGSGIVGLHTLFHEGGHAAHFLNSINKDVCVNHEYAPMTISWAEIQSMFMDSISDSIEWKTRYAKSKDGKYYPFELFERKVNALNIVRPLEMMHMCRVIFFEKEIYECKNLTKDLVVDIAKKIHKKYFDFSVETLSILNTPHIYSWNSSAYYHGYGLADLFVCQWRDYFYKKYGNIVDNPKIGKEMTKVWRLGSSYSLKNLMKTAIGKKLSPDPFIKDVTRSKETIIKESKMKIQKLKNISINKRPVDINAKIFMVHGKMKVADNLKSFEDMDFKYSSWLEKLTNK